MKKKDAFEVSGVSRRTFLRSAASSVLVPATLSLAYAAETSAPASTQEKASESTQPMVHPAGSDVLRVGVIGCGGRGTGAAKDCLNSSPNVVITALGDMFPDRLATCREKLANEFGDKFKATPETCFTGFDAYKKVLETGVDLVILATPPGFRPAHLRAAVEAGKHVFMEKPVAVDPVGVHSVIDSGEIAKNKGLCIVTGTQRRHDPVYIETIRRIHEGAIGELVGGQCYWCQEDLWSHPHKPEWSDMEWQLRNWLYFDWLSGDHIVEQHVHNIDVMNWLFDGPPERAYGMGGRQVRTDPQFGNIFDHFAIEFEYANGVRVTSLSRQIKGASCRVSEFIVGTKGTADPHGKIMGPAAFNYDDNGKPVNPYVQEHADLITAIRTGKYINEARRVAESTMTGIMGRMSAYTGQAISWKWIMKNSKLDLTPAKMELGPLPVNPIPVPGVTKLV